MSLMLNIYKVYTKILFNRVTKTLEENQPIQQAGFRSGYLSLDHKHTVK